MVDQRGSGSARRLRSQGPAEESGDETRRDQGQSFALESETSTAGEGQESSFRTVRMKSPVEEIGDFVPAPKEKINSFQISKLSASNARYWFEEMGDQLRLQKAWRAIDTYQKFGGSVFTELRKRYENWDVVNLKAKIIIRQGLNESMKMDCRPIENAGEIWSRLRDDYYQRSNGEFATLIARICGWKKGNKDILGSLRELERMNEELKDMSPEIGLHEKILMIFFLRGLGDEYKVVRETIISSGEITRKEVLGRLQAVEGERGPAEHNANRGQNSRGRGRGRAGGGRGRGGRGGFSRDQGCFVCGDKEHFARDCPERRKTEKEGSARNDKARKAQDESSDNLYESSRLVVEVEERSRRTGDTRALPQCDNWCLDSGTTIHVTGNRHFFVELEPFQATLRTGNGRTDIEGYGTVHFILSNHKPVKINNVAYAPGFTENLISTIQLFESRIGFTSDPNTGVFLYQGMKKLAKGRIHNRSVYLDDITDENALCSSEVYSAFRIRTVGHDDHFARLMHRRLGHPGTGRFDRAMVSLGSDVRSSMLENMDPCLVCTQAKTAKRINHSRIQREKRPLQKVYMDLWGPYRNHNIDDDKYYLALVDDCTRFSWIFTLADHKVDTIQAILESWLKRVERASGKTVIVVHTDNASEFKALEDRFGRNYGIEFEFTEPYTPSQNGPPERLNRFVLEVARGLLFDSRLPKAYWKYAVATANHIRNCTVGIQDDGGMKSPYELWMGSPPDLMKFRIWGCHVEFHEKPDDKLEPRTRGGTLIGYGKSEQQYYVLTDEERNIRLCTRPIFFEDRPSVLADQPVSSQNPPMQPTYEPMLEDMTDSSDGSEDGEYPPPRQSRIRRPTQALLDSRETEKILGNRSRRRSEGEQARKATRADQRRESRAVKDGRSASQLSVAAEVLLYEDDLDYSAGRAGVVDSSVRIPSNYSEAISDPVYGEKWKEAIHAEIAALVKFGTWRLRNRNELQRAKIATTKWVFNIKRGSDGRIDLFKARLVVRGFTQTEGVDFHDTFAPVFRLDSLRILLALAAQYGLQIHMLDASNAFVGSELDIPNYIHIPEGVEDFESADGSEHVLELYKSLYGLRQSAHLWHNKIKGRLLSMGFKQSTADSSVFIDENRIIIALYVDDMLVMGRSDDEIKRVKSGLKEFHPMKDYGLATKILGIRIEQGDGYVKIDQETYTREILEEFGLGDCKPQRTPLSPSVKLEGETPELSRGEHQLFRRIIGRVSFLALGTRADISFVVNRLAQHLAAPRKVHIDAGKHLLRYLRGTLDFGLIYWRVANADHKLTGYADSAYANATGKRSTAAYLFYLNQQSSPISWSSRRQPIVAQSTVEAEYMALAEAVKQSIWLRHFLYTVEKEDADVHVPVLVYEDNHDSIKLADNPGDHTKTKHIMIRYHALRDAVARGDVRLKYKPTGEMVADGLTKALTPEVMERLNHSLRLRGNNL